MAASRRHKVRLAARKAGVHALKALQAKPGPPPKRERPARAAANGVKFLDHARDPETGLLFFSTTRDGARACTCSANRRLLQGMLGFWRALPEGAARAPTLCLSRRSPDEFLAKAHATFGTSTLGFATRHVRPSAVPEARDDKETRLAGLTVARCAVCGEFPPRLVQHRKKAAGSTTSA